MHGVLVQVNMVILTLLMRYKIPIAFKKGFLISLALLGNHLITFISNNC